MYTETEPEFEETEGVYVDVPWWQITVLALTFVTLVVFAVVWL
jgi:hypothetical protein